MFFGKQQTSLEALIKRRRPSKWQRFWSNPCIFLARYVYSYRRIVHEIPTNPVSVVCISDTHNSQHELPYGDILIHAGDLTQSGSLKELQDTISWLSTQPHLHKIVVAGNHDLLLDTRRNESGEANKDKEKIDWGDCIYLEDKATTITCANGRRLKLHGSPMTVRHGNWAFQYPRTEDVWRNSVPDNTDILITHGPPFAHLDLGYGCSHLLQELWRARPTLHVYGHVHEGYGHEQLQFDRLQQAYEKTIFEGGVRNLVIVFKEFLMLYTRARKEATASCQLVNPAMVGGLRDTERRKPIKIVI